MSYVESSSALELPLDLSTGFDTQVAGYTNPVATAPIPNVGVQTLAPAPIKAPSLTKDPNLPVYLAPSPASLAAPAPVKAPDLPIYPAPVKAPASFAAPAPVKAPDLPVYPSPAPVKAPDLPVYLASSGTAAPVSSKNVVDLGVVPVSVAKTASTANQVTLVQNPQLSTKLVSTGTPAPARVVYAAPPPTTVVSANPIYELGFQGETVYMSETQYEWGKAIALMLIVLTLLFIIFFFVWLLIYAWRLKPVPPPPKPTLPPSTNWDVGASRTGASYYYNGLALTTAGACTSSNGVWNATTLTCGCKIPYFGQTCTRQSHDANYYGLGVVQPDTLSYNCQTVAASSLSFKPGGGYDPNSCTAACDNRVDCYGVRYIPKTDGPSCTLIVSAPVLNPGATIVVNPDVDSTIYLYRKGARPIITDRVFGYVPPRPLRYWSGPPAVTFWSGVVNTVSPGMIPQRLVNDGGLIGVWSTVPLDLNSYSNYITTGNTDTIFIDYGACSGYESDYPLNLPSSFAGKSLYVLYGNRP